MHVLLDDVIAAEPGEVVPVANLVFHFGLLGSARPDPHAAGVKVRAHVLQRSDHAVVKLFDGFVVFDFVP